MNQISTDTVYATERKQLVSEGQEWSLPKHNSSELHTSSHLTTTVVTVTSEYCRLHRTDHEERTLKSDINGCQVTPELILVP